MRIRRLTVLLAAFALVTAAATAGAALGSRSGSSPIQSAANKSAHATSVKFDFTLTISGAGAGIPGGKISLSGSGAVDSKHKAADFKLDLGSLAPLLAAAAKGTAVPKSIELIVVNNAIYVNFPALAKQLHAPGKTWVKFDLSKLPKSTTGGLSTKSVGSISPQQAVSVLRSALTVHKVGSDSHGDHYHGTLNIAALASLVPKAQQASAQASLAKAGLKSIPFDAWVGKAGYLTRFSASITVKATKTTPAASISLTINLHDYGHHVTVTAPPASQTADGSTLLSSLSGLGG
jgi:hypothetical protein